MRQRPALRSCADCFSTAQTLTRNAFCGSLTGGLSAANKRLGFVVRSIDRAEEPRGLALLRKAEPNKQWSSSGAGVVHSEVGEKLYAVQNHCCAYCERPLQLEDGHIEHIHPRSIWPTCDQRPSLNHHYDWHNLLLVCTNLGTCDDDKAKAGKHLCAEIYYPDNIGEDRIFLIDTYTGRLFVDPAAPAERQAKATRTIQELKLDDVGLNESRRAVIVEFQRRVFEEDISPDLASLEMHRDGFPTTVDLLRENLS
jgi:uncharacterized protein (TIGR02646 family)